MEREPMKDIVAVLFGIVAAATLIYGVSFLYFMRSHTRVGLRGPAGHALTSVYLAVPDKSFNRALAAFYGPLIERFGGGANTIEWEQP
jgi:hypothetical protein